MRVTDKAKPVSTTPQGVWEASRPESERKKKNRQFTPSTDFQGNGYPTDRHA